MKYLISIVIFCLMVKTPCHSTESSSGLMDNKYIQNHLMEPLTLSKKPQFESIEFIDPESSLLDKDFGPNRKLAPTLFSAHDIVEKTLAQFFKGIDLENKKNVVLTKIFKAGMSLLFVKSIHPLKLPCVHIENNDYNFVYHKDLLEAARAFFIIANNTFFTKITPIIELDLYKEMNTQDLSLRSLEKGTYMKLFKKMGDENFTAPQTRKPDIKGNTKLSALVTGRKDGRIEMVER